MLAKPSTKEGGGTGTRIMEIPKISEDSESEVDLALRADADSAVHPSDLNNDCMPETLLILTKFCTMMHGKVSSFDNTNIHELNMSKDISLVKTVTKMPPKMGLIDGTRASILEIVKSRKLNDGPSTEKYSGTSRLLKTT